MKVEKVKGAICGIRKKEYNLGESDAIEYEIIGVPYNNRFCVEIITDKPKFVIGDIVEVSIRQSYLRIK